MQIFMHSRDLFYLADCQNSDTFTCQLKHSSKHFVPTCIRICGFNLAVLLQGHQINQFKTKNWYVLFIQTRKQCVECSHFLALGYQRPSNTGFLRSDCCSSAKGAISWAFMYIYYICTWKVQLWQTVMQRSFTKDRNFVYLQIQAVDLPWHGPHLQSLLALYSASIRECLSPGASLAGSRSATPQAASGSL